MPRKLRRAKRRTSPAAELSAWQDFFSCGYDFFGDLQEIGIYEGDEIDHREKIVAEAKKAWSRLGVHFMAAWNEKRPIAGCDREYPWAFEEFGAP